jgi:hypothetical protein
MICDTCFLVLFSGLFQGNCGLKRLPVFFVFALLGACRRWVLLCACLAHLYLSLLLSCFLAFFRLLRMCSGVRIIVRYLSVEARGLLCSFRLHCFVVQRISCERPVASCFFLYVTVGSILASFRYAALFLAQSELRSGIWRCLGLNRLCVVLCSMQIQTSRTCRHLGFCSFFFSPSSLLLCFVFVCACRLNLGFSDM